MAAAVDKPSRGALRSNEAAEYIGLSPYTLRNFRQADSKAIAKGAKPRGPKFLRVGTTLCLYRREDLDAWLEERARATLDVLRPAASRIRKPSAKK